MTALIDADSFLYKAGFALEEEMEDGTFFVDLQNAKDFIDGLLDSILFSTDCDSYELWLTGKENFRYKVAEEGLKDNYKYNRKDSRKPDKFPQMWNYMVKELGAKVTPFCEADDVICTKKSELPNDYVVCSIDKDVLYQSAGRHYNYSTGKFVKVSKELSIWFAYYQTLTGDVTDGYKGASRIGPARAVGVLGVPSGGVEIVRGLLEKAKASPEKIKTLLKPGNRYDERQLWTRVLLTYRKCKQTRKEALATMRLAQMHQLSRDSGGRLKLSLWTVPDKESCLIDSLQF